MKTVSQSQRPPPPEPLLGCCSLPCGRAGGAARRRTRACPASRVPPIPDPAAHTRQAAQSRAQAGAAALRRGPHRSRGPGSPAAARCPGRTPTRRRRPAIAAARAADPSPTRCRCRPSPAPSPASRSPASRRRRTTRPRQRPSPSAAAAARHAQRPTLRTSAGASRRIAAAEGRGSGGQRQQRTVWISSRISAQRSNSSFCIATLFSRSSAAILCAARPSRPPALRRQ